MQLDSCFVLVFRGWELFDAAVTSCQKSVEKPGSKSRRRAEEEPKNQSDSCHERVITFITRYPSERGVSNPSGLEV